MKSLHRTLARGVSSGEPLPSPWPIFEQRKMHFRRGSISMIAGPPGSMKTILALNIVKQMGTDVPTLYHSSDSDDFTMASRSLSMLTGETTDDAELMVMAQRKAAYEALRAMEHVRWSFKSSPTFDHMQAEADAFREIKGEYPYHTVIDIMMDIDYDGVGEQNYWGLMAELKVMARDQQTAITVVHHTSESTKGGSPPPRSAIMGKANQLPALILTLWGDSHTGKLDIATVKNRFGPQDAMGKNFFSMKADPSICLIEEATEDSWENVSILFRDGTSVPAEEKINPIDWGED